MQNIGKTAPEISKLAFFSQEIDATVYWHLDLFTGLTIQDKYSPRILVNSIDSVAFNPIFHFLTLEPTASDVAIYELDLSSRDRHYIGSYPINNHYIVLEGDLVFIVDFAGGTYDWTIIDLLSQRTEPFLEDTELDELELSPDKQWLAGVNRNQHLFINILDGSSYTKSGYCCLIWSPDSHWYIAAHDNSAGIISVLSATGEAHPILPESFLASEPFWADDSQSIFFVKDNHLVSISLTTGEKSEYFPTAQSFQTSCMAPHAGHIIIHDGIAWALIDTQTGAELWQSNHDSSVVRTCLWSEDSRYLVMHLSAQASNALGTSFRRWQTFVFLDTLTGNHWDLYPENLPLMPYYIYSSD